MPKAAQRRSPAPSQEKIVPPNPSDIFNQVKEYLSSKGDSPQDIQEMKDFQSNLRSLVAREIRAKTHPNDKSGFRILVSFSKDGSVFKLCQKKNGKYWYKDRWQYVGKDDPALRERYGLPPMTGSENSLPPPPEL